MSAMTTSMRGLKQAAESGSFAISKEGAEAYIKAIEDAQKELRQLDKYNAQLAQETKLGTSPDAQAMSRYNVESANGGAGTTGILPALDQLKMALEDARLAMKKAIENYDQVDGSAASGLKRY
ncbi:hypothetical protein [Saccharothrix variisporea]|uniref:PE family protein n=1 Tax=Saccharothrix variisporea TaxID=543527 RepID=A0A495XDW3_9PSEU|nr:hypothetical protein [Saccharothrix variisporea]RKT71859.1 hypothetical protein DFJ66_5155 [Saccharothrix variisporea]